MPVPPAGGDPESGLRRLQPPSATARDGKSNLLLDIEKGILLNGSRWSRCREERFIERLERYVPQGYEVKSQGPSLRASKI
jgi:hypothetical protein